MLHGLPPVMLGLLFIPRGTTALTAAVLILFVADFMRVGIESRLDEKLLHVPEPVLLHLIA